MQIQPNIAAIVASVLEETAGQPENEIRRALRQACPYGPTEYRRINEWRDEIARQRGQFNRRPAARLQPIFMLQEVV